MRGALAGATLLLGVAVSAAEAQWPAAGERATARARLGGMMLVLEAEAWVDRMPMALEATASPAAPVMMSVRVVAESGPLPAGLAADSAWLRRGRRRWRGVPTAEQPPEADRRAWMLRDLPSWVGDGPTDLLLRVRTPGSAPVLLRLTLPAPESVY
ncbi:MAG: hypothetical protein NW201_00565 [Gemmatimonadales bacterium]|nr:hypothetical protein [Gemmatimonadales bacterium]